MIWNDELIALWAANGGVTPYREQCVNPASLDLRWSGRFRVASAHLKDWTPLVEADELLLEPGRFYLLDTLEYVNMPSDVVGKLFLKSSAGRMGIEHLHAGYIDPDFHGTITMEIELRVPWSVTIVKEQRLVQLTFETMTAAPLVSYKLVGRYSGQKVPTVSKGLQNE